MWLRQNLLPVGMEQPQHGHQGQPGEGTVPTATAARGNAAVLHGLRVSRAALTALLGVVWSLQQLQLLGHRQSSSRSPQALPLEGPFPPCRVKLWGRRFVFIFVPTPMKF